MTYEEYKKLVSKKDRTPEEEVLFQQNREKIEALNNLRLAASEALKNIRFAFSPSLVPIQPNFELPYIETTNEVVQELQRELDVERKKSQKLRRQNRQLQHLLAGICQAFDLELQIPYSPADYDSWDDFEGISMDSSEPF